MSHNKKNRKQLYIVIIALLLIQTPLFAQQPTSPLSINTINFSNQYVHLDSIVFTVQWSTLEVITNIHYWWEPDPENQYFNPERAYTLTESYATNIFSVLTTQIYIKEQQSLLDFTRDASLYQTVLSQLLADSTIIAQIPDNTLLGTTIQYHTSLTPLIQKTIYPSLQSQEIPYVGYPINTIEQYTSIIFATNLPIPLLSDSTQEISFSPSILPQVYDMDTNALIFTPQYFQPSSDIYNNPFTYIYPSDYQLSLTGDNPLYIIPIGIDHAISGNLYIDSQNTREILSSEHNRQLIREGKVFFIIHASQPIILK